jgi:uncharacterized membrane protein
MMLGFIAMFLLGAAAFVFLIVWLTTLGQRRRLKTLEDIVMDLRARLDMLSGERPVPPVPSSVSAADRSGLVKGIVAAPPPRPQSRPFPNRPLPPDPVPPAESAPVGHQQASGPTSSTGSGRRSLEQNLASRWLVWLGSATTILAGVFLVKYSVENDLISPTLRISAGVLAGLVLVLSSEWVRRRSLRTAITSPGPDHVSAALGAAGVAILFGAIYAGHALYDLYGSMVAFVVLALVAFTTLGISLLQGQLIAALGIGAALVLPLLISTPDPSAWALFPYLFCVAAAGFAINRYKDWHWLALTIIGGCFCWVVAWTGAQPAMEVILLGVFVTAVMALSMVFRFEVVTAPVSIGEASLAGMMNSPVHRNVGFAAAAALVEALFIVHWSGFGGSGLTVFATVIVAVIGLSVRAPRFEALAMASALAALLLLVTWSGDQLLDAASESAVWGISLQGTASDIPIAWDTVFIRAAVVMAIGFALIADWGLRRAGMPVLWAAVGAGTPIATTLIAYWRLEPTELSLAWTIIGLVVAAWSTLSAVRLARIRERPGMEGALGCYALAALAAILLSGGIALEERWMTIFVSALLAAAGWVNSRARIPFIRSVVLVIATIVVGRLFLQALPITSPVFSNGIWATLWKPDTGLSILYGNGVPALAFLLAGRWFAVQKRDRLTDVLECGALSFVMLLFAMEIRHFVAELEPSPTSYGLLEQSLNSITWLIMGTMLYRRGAEQTVVRLWGARVLLILAAAQILFLQLIAFNPVITHETVWSWPILNKLFLAYCIPALALAWLRGEATRQGHHAFANQASIAAMGLGFIFVSLQVRQVFHGADIGGLVMYDAENYTYSGVWLTLSMAALSIGLLTDRVPLRHAGMGLMLLVSLKVFLWDMASLDGLLRVASFLGLGLSLIGVGYLYQKLVLRKARKPSTEGAAT